MQPRHDVGANKKPIDHNVYKVFQCWIWEILSIIVAIGLIVAIAVLLITNDGKPAPDWGEQINLNALLATLSTILRAMLVVVVSQIISQRKWEWFEAIRERPLLDLQKFDSGSRGPAGAIQLLPVVFWRDPTTFMAAIILFTSFLVGPSVQQASRTSECTIVATGLKASLPFAHYIPRRSGFVSDVERDDLGVPAPDLITAILSAVTAPDSVENRIRGSCSTGNCTFPIGDPAESDSGLADEKNSITHATVAMCSKCTDISSLVVRENETCGYPVLSLPNNISLSRGCGDREVVRVRPNIDLSWMGDLLTPESRSASRWAYVNASFIGLNSYANETVAAVMCSLYPCLQTYTASITENEVSETKVGSKVMQLDLLSNNGVGESGEHNALENVYKSYTAIQSPCRAQGNVYDMKRNSSAQVNGTDLALYDFTDYGDQGATQSTSVNITAPKECIYRQHPQLVVAVSRLLNNEIFNGSCSVVKTFNCRDTGSSDSDDKFIPFLGAETVLRDLYGESYKGESNLTTGLSNVTKWFDLFAEAMTKRFRSDYGAADVVDRRRDDVPPLDEIQGLAWQSTTCVSMRIVWLVFPIILTVFTAALAMWTIATNWRHRQNTPVWKDSILPLMFYGRDIVNGTLDRYNHESSEQISQDQTADQTEIKKSPLEIGSMEKIGQSTAVIIPWLQGAGNNGEESAMGKRAKWSWRHKKNRNDDRDDQIPVPGEGTETHQDIQGDQTAPSDVGSHEDSRMLEVAQIDRDAQPPVLTVIRGTRSSEEAGPQQTSPIYPQTYPYGGVGVNDDAGAHSFKGNERDMQTQEGDRSNEEIERNTPRST
jgi:hypothetical protein